MTDKPLAAMSRTELEDTVRANRAVAMVPVQQATVVGPTTAETAAADKSMRPSWQRVESWLIVSFQVFITWLGIIAGDAIVDKFIASETVEATEMLAAIGVLSATVGAIPYLYLKARIGERKEVAQEASPTVVMHRRPPQGDSQATDER